MDSMAQQMTEALMIMVLGMGLVFIFLTILILGVTLVARKFGPEQSEMLSSAPTATTAEQHQGVDPKMVAVITAAVHQYRAKAQ